MPTSFVSLLTIFKYGFDKLDEIDPAIVEQLFILRQNLIEDLYSNQFVLVYYTNMSLEDTERLTPFEMKSYLELLKKQKDLEMPK